VFDEADKQFDLLFSGIRAGRSLAASYNLQSDIQSMCLNDRRTCSPCSFADHHDEQSSFIYRMRRRLHSSSLKRVLSLRSPRAASWWKLYATSAKSRLGVARLSLRPQSACTSSCA
jgi:hypothetical protein